MIEIKDIGSYDSIPELASYVIDENINMLDKELSKGLDLDEEIKFSKYTSLSPLALALIMNKAKSVEWIVEKGANLNDEDNPSFLLAVRYCDEPMIRYLVSKGAKTDVFNMVDTDAYEQALYGGKIENLALIDKLGHSVKKYGGPAFRKAVSEANYEAVDFFIDRGVDINFNRPDDVYSFSPTPLCVAARYVDLKMCKYLVNRGADVTITEKDGMRPYSIAVEKGDMEMADYFKALEPEDFHNIKNKLDELKAYKLPKPLLEFLQGDKLRFELEDCDFDYIEFFPLIETIPMKIGRSKLLRISKSTGDYDHFYIVWNPKSKKISAYDLEHEELYDLCSFKDFMEDISGYLQKVIDGDI
jgi:hypothetical protein